MLHKVKNYNFEELNNPFYIFKPKKLEKNIDNFLRKFDGETIYSVKTNPDENVLKKIYQSGIMKLLLGFRKEQLT